MIHANFLPVLTSAPGVEGRRSRRAEQDLWHEVMSWGEPGPAALVWIVSPDRRVREPVFYFDYAERRPITPVQFEARLREICAANGLAFREP